MIFTSVDPWRNVDADGENGEKIVEMPGARPIQFASLECLPSEVQGHGLSL
jgi:hypothetical protein